MKKYVIFRRISQIFFLTLFFYILWSTTYPLTGLLHPKYIFKIDPLVMIATSIGERIILPGIFFAAAMLLLTFVLGRFFCGWMCPLGTMVDGFGSLKKRKKILSDGANRKARKTKFYILGIIAIAAFLGIQVAWPLDPMVIMARFVSLDLVPSVTWAIDNFFITLIKTFNLYGPVYDFYQTLKSSLLGVRVHFFANSGIAFGMLLVVGLLALLLSRFWCRFVCPLGALYCLTAKTSLLARSVENITGKELPKSYCRMGAIQDGMDTVKGECILCMDCLRKTADYKTKFTWPSKRKKKNPEQESGRGISRKDFLWLLASSFAFLGFNKQIKRADDTGVIRPPGALKEKGFVDRCIRCGNCMKVCPTNVLQPSMLEAGPEGIWTPHAVNEIGYCEYNCTLCGEVCPTGAIAKLPIKMKQKAKMGIARVDRPKCIAWAEGAQCLVCEEHCPIPNKAIKIEQGRVGKPVVDKDLCIGCGICQFKCPVRPTRAIRVYEEGSVRT